MDKKNIFIIGLNDFNLGELNSIDGAENYNFINVFHINELHNEAGKPDIKKLIETGKKRINDHPGSVDGIIGFFDFPVTLLTFYLCGVFNIKSPSLLSGLKCEHKYWSRVEQKKTIADHIPEFMAINPFDPVDFDEIELKKPFWLKPVKSYAAQLGFKIGSEKEYEEALASIRENIDYFADPFNYLLSEVELPPEIKGIDGNYCLAEEIIKGHQCTLSGYVYNGEVTTYGIVDSVNYEQSPSFFYYLLPGKLPEKIQDKMREVAEKVMKQIGFDNYSFNIEFYYDEENEVLNLLEINPRMSQSHSDLYAKVRGSSNHEILVNIVSGEEPDFDGKQGEYKCAGKFHYRVFIEDGVVKSVPSEKEKENVEKKFPGTVIDIEAEEGKKLSEHPFQETYSYRLVNIFTGAQSEKELVNKYHEIVERMGIEIEELR